MIEWGTGNITNQVNSDFYWDYSQVNTEILVTSSALSLILPAVSYPRMITLNIAKTSLESPADVNILFYMNQNFVDLNYTHLTIDVNFNFQGKKGLNIIDWLYSGSLHALGDQANLSGAIVTVKTATKVYI